MKGKHTTQRYGKMLTLKFSFATNREARIPNKYKPARGSYSVRGVTASPRRLHGQYSFTCQNGIPQYIAGFLRDIYQTNPSISIRADMPSLKFDITTAGYDRKTATKTETSILTPERMANVMGQYALQVSPMVSPYFVRHLIDDYRTEHTIRAYGGADRATVLKRLEVIREASEQGIPLNTDIRQTWGVNELHGYGMFRTEVLWQSDPLAMRDDTGYFEGKGYQPKDWDGLCEVFPPRSIRGEPVV
jgi:hypothetical protein